MATEEEIHDPNSYFQAFDGIVEALDALVKTVTPDEEDDGTPPGEGERPCCNSYFSSFRNVRDALERLKAATEERLVALTEKDPTFAEWKNGANSINVGANSSAASNGVAVGSGASSVAGTGTGADDSGAVALGRNAQACGKGAVALGKGAKAGTESSRTTVPTVQLGTGTNASDGTLQFRDWQLVDATGKVPKARLPEDAGGIVEATGSFGTAVNRTNGLWYAIFTLEGLGIAEDAVVLSGLSVSCSTGATLPSSDPRKVELRSEDGTTLIAESENLEAFNVAGAAVRFTFKAGAELRRGVRYRIKMATSSGDNAATPMMLSSTDGAGGYLGSFINGTSSVRTDYFPCMSFTLLRPAPDIASVLGEARDAIESMGGLDFAAPVASGGSVSLRNRAVNSVTLNGTATAFAFPQAISGIGRAFILRLTMSASTNWSLPSGVTFEGEGDVFDAVQAGETAVFIFSEMTAGRFMVSRKTVSAVVKE